MLRCTIPSFIRFGMTGLPFLTGLLMIGSPAETHPQTRVYHCTNQAGEIEFRQTPCAPSAEEQELTIDDRRTGWVPPKPRQDPSPRQGREGRKKSGQGAPKAMDSKADERCWKKRRQLEEVSWRLRRGYKPGAGAKLRRRRDGYEAYIDRFCEGLGR